MGESAVRGVVIEVLRQVYDEFGEDGVPPELADDIVLLDSGLDSLAFAVIVAELDDRLGIDPFTTAEDPVYPSTIGEFVQVYEAASPVT